MTLLAGFRSSTGIGDDVTLIRGEGDAVGLVGVAGDPQSALVVEPVVVGAEADQVPGVGRAVVLPVNDVVHLEPVGFGATGDPASVVTRE